MPLIRVELFDFRVNEETSAKLIAGLTDALCEATSEGLRAHTWVIVEGTTRRTGASAGSPGPSARCLPGRRSVRTAQSVRSPYRTSP